MKCSHTLRLAPNSKKYCRTTLFYGSTTYIYLRLGMVLSVIPAKWQQFTDMVFENIPFRDRYKIIMDDIMVFLRKTHHFEDLAHLFKAFKKSGLKI